MLWFEITKMLTAVLKKIIVLFIIIFDTLSFPKSLQPDAWASGRG